MKNNAFRENIPESFRFRGDAVEDRLLGEYGAVLVARGGAAPPEVLVFADGSEVERFQAGLSSRRAVIGGLKLELQRTAMDALLEAVAAAAKSGLSITPRGADSAKRSYEDTVELWRSRVDPALDHWVNEGRLATFQADELRSLSPYEQVPRVFELEAEGLWFAKDLSKSIIYSVAPPGASQHLAMLAFDVAEFNETPVRKMLADHYWYQTVVSDLPHFTFLGVPEHELQKLGLKLIQHADRDFWVPDL